MKLQRESGYLQLNLSLLDQPPSPLPEGQYRGLTSALIELSGMIEREKQMVSAN